MIPPEPPEVPTPEVPTPEVPSPDSAGEDCASRLRVLAVGTRLEVLQKLLAGPMRAGQLQQALDIPQNLLSHHLRVLREAGLVVAERQGRAVQYRIAEHVKLAAGGSGLDLGCCRLNFD